MSVRVCEFTLIAIAIANCNYHHSIIVNDCLSKSLASLRASLAVNRIEYTLDIVSI